MSDSSGESRILPWPGPGRPPGPGPWPPGGWRPPVGPWPPGPPGPGPFPQPPDVFSAFAWLAKNYQEAKAAREFLKLLISDLIAEDPTFLANAHATVGVTDGSQAQPGMVGEWVRFEQQLTLATGTNTQIVSLGVLPPGDWDVSASAYTSAISGTAAALNYVNANLAPVPPGLSDQLLLTAAMPTPVDTISITSSLERALIPVPTLIAFTVTTGVTAAGNMWLIFAARRMR